MGEIINETFQTNLPNRNILLVDVKHLAFARQEYARPVVAFNKVSRQTDRRVEQSFVTKRHAAFNQLIQIAVFPDADQRAGKASLSSTPTPTARIALGIETRWRKSSTWVKASPKGPVVATA